MREPYGMPLPTLGSGGLPQSQPRRSSLDGLLRGLDVPPPRFLLVPIIGFFLVLAAVERGRVIRERRLARMRAAAAAPYPHGQQSQVQRQQPLPPRYPTPWVPQVRTYLQRAGEYVATKARSPQ